MYEQSTKRSGRKLTDNVVTIVCTERCRLRHFILRSETQQNLTELSLSQYAFHFRQGAQQKTQDLLRVLLSALSGHCPSARVTASAIMACPVAITQVLQVTPQCFPMLTLERVRVRIFVCAFD